MHTFGTCYSQRINGDTQRISSSVRVQEATELGSGPAALNLTGSNTWLFCRFYTLYCFTTITSRVPTSLVSIFPTVQAVPLPSPTLSAPQDSPKPLPAGRHPDHFRASACPGPPGSPPGTLTAILFSGCTKSRSLPPPP